VANGQPKVINGCGADGTSQVVQNIFQKRYSLFTPACDNHDACYQTCNRAKATCDANFRDTILTACDKKYPGFINASKRNACRLDAAVIDQSVRSFGEGAYEDAQGKVCRCCAGTRYAFRHRGGRRR
jgi:hypothetical protein